MAVLSNPEREAVSASYRDTFSNETVEASKTEVTQLLSDLDDFLDSNAAVINTSIRAGIRNKFTARQKARALVWVIRRRFEVS